MSRTITTAAELDALPFRSTVTLHDEDWRKRHDGSWLCDDGDILTAGGLVRYAEHCGVALVLAPSVVPEAAVEAGVEALLRECDLADADMRKWVRVPVRNLRAALTATLPLLTDTPKEDRDDPLREALSAYRAEVDRATGSSMSHAILLLAGAALVNAVEAAITPKEDR